MTSKCRILLVITLTFILSACGGGGGSGSGSGSGSGTNPNPQLPPSFSGTVAIGAGVQNAEISLRDLEGLIDSTISDARGGWILPLSNLKRVLKPPYIVSAKFEHEGKPRTLFSISTDDAAGNTRINITPLTDVITRAYTSPDANEPDAIEGLPNNPGKLKQIQSRVKEMLGELMPKSVDDFIKDPFTPDPRQSEHDALLELSRVVFENGSVKLTDVNSTTMAARSLNSLNSNTPDTRDTATVSKVEATRAVSVRGEFPATTPPIVNKALMIVTAVTPGRAVVGESTSIVVRGENLGNLNSIRMDVVNCEGVQAKGGTDTSRTFTCTPTSEGTKSGLLFDAKSLRDLFRFSFIVSAATTPAAAPVINSIEPTTAQVNKPTRFTATGTNLVDGMDVAIDGCKDYVPSTLTTGSSTQQSFTCTPTAVGVKQGYWNAPGTAATGGGKLVIAFSISVITGSAVQCTSQPQRFTSIVRKFCYYLNSDGKEVYHGLFEKYEGNDLTEQLIYKDGMLDGPAKYYSRVLINSGPESIYLLRGEGVYSQGKEIGTWKYYAGDVGSSINSLGKLSSEIVWGILFEGSNVPAVKKIYCDYEPNTLAAKHGKLYRIDTLNLATGASSEQRLFKTGCYGPD